MLDRSIAPAFNRSTSFELLTPEKIVLKDGAEAYFIHGGDQDVSKIEFLFLAGRWYEKSFGAAYFTANLLTKGTNSKSSFEIAELFDRYGAHVEISPGLDFITVSIYSLNKNLEQVLKLLLELFQHATFPDKELDQLKSIYLQNFKVNQAKTSFEASKRIRKNIFGNTHPYGKELEPSDIERISRQDLVDHFNAHFTSATLFAAGKLTEANQRLIASMFSGFAKNTLQRIDFEPDVQEPKREIIQKENSFQSSLRIAKKSIGRPHTDYPKLLFVTHLLGGYFGSRLMKNIREEKGLTYGIHASLHTLKNDSFLTIGADVNKENIELTFSEVKKEMQRLCSEPINREELDMARNHFIGGLQLEMTTAFAHIDKLKSIYLFNLAPLHYQHIINQVDGVESADIQAIAQKYLTPDSFFEVAVG